MHVLKPVLATRLFCNRAFRRPTSMALHKHTVNTPVMSSTPTPPPVQKKDISKPLATLDYDPIAIEAGWYEWWESQGFFKPDEGQIKPAGLFVMTLPPPNVTGHLHIGHALTVAIQDALIRWNRMLGKTTLFLPGVDHAGISTQSVVEKRLYKTDGLTRHDLGREKFVERVSEWKDDYKKSITNQLRRLGGSYDWSREAFTMNPIFCEGVNEAFCRFYEDGILYRSNRLVNWCVQLRTTISNIEVEQKQLSGRTLLNVPGYGPKEKFEFGVITSFRYLIAGTDDSITVATTRPETMLGDTAIAVHPDDDRYTAFHGKFAVHPFIPHRRIPIVTDAVAVDMTFGTGAVKITPAHDHNDYAVGKRHNLEFINILNDDGTLNSNAGPTFAGMKRYHARVAVLEALKDKGLYVETKDNPMQIPLCAKSGDVIELVLKPQWWVNTKVLAAEAVKRTESGDLVIAPAQSAAEWFRWMNNMQDWCISRQLWWGHRCPAYVVRFADDKGRDQDEDVWVVGRTLAEAMDRGRGLAEGRPFTLEQDPDVLDTWFSAGLYPFASMGWPHQTDDLERFFPSTVLETGWDILTFWVARMVMMSLHLTGRMPFREVYCHAMIRDGRKMSKSLGNVIDPIDIIQGQTLEVLHKKLYDGNLDEREISKAKQGQKKDFPAGIPQCGTDALRFALCAYSGGGRDINLEILRVQGYRKFCNKIFNAVKFAMLKFDSEFVPYSTSEVATVEGLPEQWILHKLNVAAATVNLNLTRRNFMAATTAIHHFWLHELCDVYIEVMKPIMEPTTPIAARKSVQQTLYTCLDHGLRLLHVFMPFITEELWQRLLRRPGDNIHSIMVAPFPVENPLFNYPASDQDFGLILSLSKAGRSLAVSYNLQSNILIFIQAADDQENKLIESHAPTIAALVKGCQAVRVVRSAADIPDGCGSALITQNIQIHILVRGYVDIDNEIAKYQKKIDLALHNLAKIQKLQQQPGYSANVPINVRDANEVKRQTIDAELAALKTSRSMFAKLK